MKSTICLFMLAVFLGMTSTGFGTERGTTAADFLKIGMGAGPAGLGEAYSSRSGDVASMFYNPAGIAEVGLGMASATHLNWIAETRYDALAVAYPLVGIGTVGVGLALLTMPDIPEMDQTGQMTGAIQVYDGALQMSYARELTAYTGIKNLASGASLKIVRRKLGSFQATGVAMDLGGHYQLWPGWNCGLAVQNLGYLSSFAAATDKLPIILRAGTGYSMQFTADQQVEILGDLIWAMDNTPRVNLGAEYNLFQMIHLRLGYKLGYDTDGFQAGAGISWQAITVDYAVKAMQVFGLTHFITATVGFGTPRQWIEREQAKKYLEAAEQLYNQSKYTEAMPMVDRAIEVDPKNEQALQLKEKLQSVLQILQMPGGPKEQKAVTPGAAAPTPDQMEEQGQQPQPQEAIPQ